ncbi:MAG: tandem-95 repeat protein [Kiritimatiellaeota bacterium]|nr:tandem-95 repeat protein [Kiritimatiellota bacterium]
MKRTIIKALFALCLAGAAHAQVAFTPNPVTVYTGASTNIAYTITAGFVVLEHLSAPTGAFTVTGMAATTPGTYSGSVTAGSALGAATYRAVCSNLTTSAISTNTLNITVRERPVVTGLALATVHDNHLHSAPGAVQTSVLTGTLNANATSFTAVSANTTLFTVTPGPVATLGALTVTPVANANGTADLTVYGRDTAAGGLGGVSTNTIAVTVRPALTVTAPTPNPLTFDEDTSGQVTFRVNTCYPFAADNVSYFMTEPYMPQYPIIASNVTTMAVSGGFTNMTTTFYPMPDAYGVVTARLEVAVGALPYAYTYSTNIVINVTPVPDPPRFVGIPDEVIIANTDPWTNAFTGVTITDPDDFPPPPPNTRYKELLDVTVSNATLGVVFDSSGGFVETSEIDAPTRTNTLVQSTWLQGLDLKARSDLLGVIGMTNTYEVIFTALGADGLSCTTTMPVRIWFKNTPPVFVVNLKEPGLTVTEGYPIKPFTLTSLEDPDIGQTHTLTARLADESLQYGNLNGTLNPVTVGVNGNLSTLNTALINLEFNAHDGVMTNDTETVYVIFEMYDGFDTTVNTNTITLVQQRRPPVINLGGMTGPFPITTDTSVGTRLFPQITVTDPDEGGNQFVRAQIAMTPAYLTLEGLSGITTLQHPADLTTLLRGVTFLPDLSSPLASVPIGSTVTATITITATDKKGLDSEPRIVTVSIERLNAAPIISVPADQPVLFAPGSVIYPFADIDLWNDDPDPVKFTFVMDNPEKGAFSNAVGLTQSGNGFTITDSVPNILAAVTNVAFILNAGHEFPPDDPGGTTFTLSAQDAYLASTSANLTILVQDPPRNWLVTKLLDDGTPGTFSHALARFGNNDVITFALPEEDYPATVRLTNAPEVTADKALTIKGPGADLLTLSGDINGNGLPDRRLMTVAAPVTLEGLTLADCTGDFGGAVSVIEKGHLILRQVTIRDCVATDAGGAVDVDHGCLTVDGALFLRNSTTTDAPYGGGALSLYTDTLITIRNAVFAENRQRFVGYAGGGAIYAEFPSDSPWFLDIDVTHCTFIDNEDDTFSVDLQGTSILANGACAFYLENNIFADDPLTRSLNTAAAAEIWSFGGNICDDNSSVFLNQGGGAPQKILLNHSTDVLQFATLFDDAFAPLNLGAYLAHATVPTDLAGRIRNPLRTLPGALDPAAAPFPAITEIQLSGYDSTYFPLARDRFIEVYAPRDSKGVLDLTGMTLVVNGVPVHTFGEGVIANPASSTLFNAGDDAATVPLSYIFTAGRGVLIAFPADPSGVAEFQSPMDAANPTPVVSGSIVSNATDFAALLSIGTGRGWVAIYSPDSDIPIVRHTFLTEYNDPDSPTGTDPLNTGIQSIATIPFARGFAFIPHLWESPLEESPGADNPAGTPFGGDHPPPLARDDLAMATEDDAVLIDVLANDLDYVGDPLSIVAFDAASDLGAAVTFDAATGALRYDPVHCAALQAQPAGRELIDTFDYTIWAGRILPFGAGGSVAVDALATDTVTITLDAPHGLEADAPVWFVSEAAAYTNRLVLSAVPDAASFQITFAAPAEASAFADFLNNEGLADFAVYTRHPAFTATATVTVRFEGLNDNPVGTDDLLIASLTEREAVRLLAQPNLSASAVFNEYPETPVSGVGLLANDTDVDEGDTPDTFRITGILSDADVHTNTAFAASPDGTATRVTSPAHGLANGATVTIVGVENPARVNGARAVTVIDADTFDLPVAPGEFIFTRACWVPTTTATAATTPLGAEVALVTRANPLEDNIIYNADASAQLRKLAQGESVEDGFWYILVDRLNAPGIAYVSLTVNGVNDDPVVRDEPPGLDDIIDFFGDDDLLNLFTNRISVLTVLVPPMSGSDGRADLILADNGAAPQTAQDLLLLPDFFSTDAQTPLVIDSAEVLARATDVDTNDVLFVHSVEAASMLGAAVAAGPGFPGLVSFTYNPQGSAALRALGIGETAFDVLTVNVSDGIAIIPMRVVVLVRGVNDAPWANPVYVYNPGARTVVGFTPNVGDHDVNDTLTLVTPATTNVTVPNPTAPTNEIPYTVTDHSLFLAMDDTFRVPMNAPVTTLDVLANDVNFHDTGITLTSVTPSLRGGTVSVNIGGTALLYTPPADFAGTDIFTYAVTNALGIARRANVRVHVILNDYNGPLHACDDEYAVARGMGLDMPVTVNDVLLPASPAGLTVDPDFHADWPAGLTLNGNVFHYASAAGDPDVVTFTYRVLGGGGSVSDANVRIKIIDRVIGIQPDWFTAAPGAAPVSLDVLANDVMHGDSNDGMIVTGVDATGAFGTVAIAPDGRSVTYAAPAGFIGVDIFRYTAVDRYGAQGATNVYVTVGVPIATPDNVTVAINTNVLIDVLANDTVRPYAPPTSLTLTDVFLRAGETANGTATLEANAVRFASGPDINATAIWLYTYTVPNTDTVVTGEVTIVTSSPGALYANADNFTVRQNAADVVLDVLANDASYRAVQYPLTIQNVQAVSVRNGTLTTDGETVTYTPAPGFEGEDTFSYIASDGTGTAQGFVTVHVVPGDLIANDDAFIIGFDWDGTVGAAKAYTLPVLRNDAVFPGAPVDISVTPNFGIGADAPQFNSTLEVSPDGKAVVIRPGDSPAMHGGEYLETFTYEVEDIYGRKQSARVAVTVRQRSGEIEMEIQDDAFNVERNSVNNVLPVTANDLVEPKTPLPVTGIHVSATIQYGEISVAGLNLIYTPPPGFVGVDTATYTIDDGLGGSGTATVTIFVGALPAAPDAFNVLRGSTNTLDVLSNDAITAAYLASYHTALTSVQGATHGGDISISGTAIRYVPDPAYGGGYPYTETFTYTLEDDTGRLTEGTVTVAVHDWDAAHATSVIYVINDNGAEPSTARDAWNRRYFGDGYVTDPNAFGSADPDGDGLNNDAEYVFGGDPTVYDPTVGRITITMRPDGTADLTYTRRDNDPTLVFTLHACDDLIIGDWQPVTDDTLTFVAHTDTELTIATHNVPVPAAPKQRFFKIIVTF